MGLSGRDEPRPEVPFQSAMMQSAGVMSQITELVRMNLIEQTSSFDNLSRMTYRFVAPRALVVDLCGCFNGLRLDRYMKA